MSSRATRQKGAVAEDGFALLDVVIAIVLLPVAYLLSITNKTVVSNQFRLTAQSIAASWLQQEQTAASQCRFVLMSYSGTNSIPVACSSGTCLYPDLVQNSSGCDDAAIDLGSIQLRAFPLA